MVELSTDFDDDDDSEYPEPPSDDEDAPPNNDGTLRFAEVSDESYVDSEESDDDSDLYAVDSRGNTKVYTPSVVKMYRAGIVFFLLFICKIKFLMNRNTTRIRTACSSFFTII